MITLPENWSDWTVTGELGRGAFSVVYEAERKDDPSVHCAIKLISIPQDDFEYDDLIASGFTPEISKNYFTETVEELTREIRLMEHFKGMPNIVSIEDYKVVPREDGVGSFIYIRMELLTSLEKYISDKTLTEKEVVQLGIDLCTALELCHDQHIIHRDIKPANVFVNDRIGAHVIYKLGDFGIARNLEAKTLSFSSKGTPNYMAPEVAANKKYDETADIYSLGLTLYWLMNNKRLPFYPQTQLYSPAAKREALQRRLNGEPLDPPVHASEALAHIILKACRFNPEERYQNAGRMKASLKKLQNALEPPPIVSIHTEMALPDSPEKGKPAGKKPAKSTTAARKPVKSATVSPKSAKNVTAVPKPAKSVTAAPKPVRNAAAGKKTGKSTATGRKTRKKPVLWMLCAALLLCAGFTAYRILQGNRPAAPNPETDFTPASEWTIGWFRNNPETDPAQPQADVRIDYEIIYDDSENETGWMVWPVFTETHGQDFRIYRLVVRWFFENQGNVVLKDIVYETENTIQAALRSSVLHGYEETSMGVRGELPLFDPSGQKIDGIGAALFGTDSKGNVYEFRGYQELPKLTEPQSAQAQEADQAQETAGDHSAAANPETGEASVSLQQGDSVYFGRYQQRRGSTGGDPIEWLVLDQRDGAVFLVSRYALEAMAFNNRNDGTTWKNSTIRTWLNREFPEEAFTDTEREAIRETEVDNSEAQGLEKWNNAGRAGGSTTDRVFLLSYLEVQQYLTEEDWFLCPVTGHTNKKVYKTYPKILEGRETCDYWLRNAAYKNNVAVVQANGVIGPGVMTDTRGAVRPALWVDISAVTKK